MQFENSEISKQLLYTTKILSFGKIHFLPKFIISEMDYGIHLDWNKIEELIQVVYLHYGVDCKIGYISNRINSYSFEPNLWDKFYKKHDFIVASVSVCYSHINYINATIEKSQQTMNALNKVYTPVIYEGAGHGFFRAGEADNASEANIKARKAGLERLQKLLSAL